MSKAFCWVDLETTGLSYIADDVLEIGIVITDFHFRPKVNIHRLVKPERLLQVPYMEQVVFDMHEASGLLEALNGANLLRSIHELDVEISDILRRVFEEEGFDCVMLAGNTVHFDKGFIDAWMPLTAALMHYRLFDVRTLQTFAEICGTEIDNPKVQPEHRSMNDINTSLNFMRKFYMPFEETSLHAEHLVKIL